jgi:AsnC-type helix-turn-helix domain
MDNDKPIEITNEYVDKIITEACEAYPPKAPGEDPEEGWGEPLFIPQLLPLAGKWGVYEFPSRTLKIKSLDDLFTILAYQLKNEMVDISIDKTLGNRFDLLFRLGHLVVEKISRDLLNKDLLQAKMTLLKWSDSDFVTLSDFRIVENWEILVSLKPSEYQEYLKSYRWFFIRMIYVVDQIIGHLFEQVQLIGPEAGIEEIYIDQVNRGSIEDDNHPPFEPDPMDQRIIGLLKGDPRLTDSMIGQKLGLSREAVNRRKQPLKKAGLIP